MRYRKWLWTLLFLLLLSTRAWAQGGDTTRFVEEFNEPWPSANWVAGPEYMVVSGELQNTDIDETWHHLAVFTGIQNVQDISVVWGNSVFADNNGSGAAAIAVGLDSDTMTANGYAVVKRVEGLQLYVVQNGDLGSLLDQTAGTRSLPGGGDTTRVVFRDERDGYYFDVYVNGQYDGTVVDSAKTFSMSSPYYAGVILYGTTSGVNNVEAVIFTSYTDGSPPETIDDLAATASTPFSVRLTWTAPRDLGGTERRAYSYDIRYSTAPIDEQTFASAKEAFGAWDVIPAEPGTLENFTVYGLKPGVTYYFAIRSADGLGHVSAVSVVPTAQTPPKPDRQIYFDGFSAQTLDPFWVAPQELVPQNDELRNTGAESLLGVWTGETDPSRVAVRWGSQVDSLGVAHGGVALMLDGASTTANGYFLTHQGDSLKLFQINSGAIGNRPIAAARTASGRVPKPADLMEVEILDDDAGTHFLVFVNGEIDGILHEPAGSRPQAAHYYAGVVLSPGATGSVDEFIVEIPAHAPVDVTVVQGDNQSSQVATRLPQPLTVKVSDADGNPVPGVMVDFQVVNGTGFLSVDSLAIDGHYFLEAEKGRLRGAVQTVSDALASDTVAVVNQATTHSYVEYPLYIANPDTYRIWLRYIALDQSSNSLYGFQLDGGDTLRNPGADWDLPVTANYQWYEVPGVSLVVDRGVHHLRILFLDVGFRLDKILLNRDPGFQPMGLGEAAANPTNLTDENGQAYTWLTLDTLAGPVQVQARVPGVDSVVFHAEAAAGPAAKLLIVSGDNQQGPAGQALPESLAVRVTDVYGNPIAGVDVQFQVMLGNGSVSPTTVSTDAAGEAKCLWTLGTDTTFQTVRATSAVIPGQTVVFSAQVSEGIPTSLVEAGGNNQEGTVGKPLADSLKVRVLDNAGHAVAGHLVNFWIRSGGGTLNGVGTNVNVHTNSQGYAAVELTLPTGARSVEVRAQAFWNDHALNGSPVIFTATALPDVPYRMVLYSGDDQTGPVGTELPQPLVVQIEDQYGNTCPGHTVHFEVLEGGGSFAGQQAVDVVTDDDGHAAVRYTLGTRSGVVNRVAASSEYSGVALHGSPVIFTATPQTGPPAELVYVTGDSQEARVGEHLPNPLVVRVTDAFGNPISGFPVDFEVKSGGGQLDSARALTDADGYARTGLTVGTVAGAGNQTVWATASQNGTPLDGSPVVFQLTALPDVPHTLAIAGGNGQVGQVGTTLPQPFAARVTDQYGNPVPGHPVRFDVVEGGGSIDGQQSVEVNTGQDGVARVFLTLGPQPGSESNKVEARSWYNSAELAGSPVMFVASSVPGEARRLVKISGNNQIGKAGSDLLEPFVVRVTDEVGNPIAGYLVHIRVVAGGGNIGGATELDLATNSEGLIRATLTLGPVAGDSNNVVEFSAPNLEGSPVRFVASALPDDPQQIVAVGGDGQTGPAGTPLPQPFVVRVTDRFGNAVPGHPVLFRVVNGGGSFDGAAQLQVTTDDSGRASVVYTLGPSPGDQNNVVEAVAFFQGTPLAGSPVRFTASAVLGPPTRLTYVSGDSQTGIVNGPLLYPFKVRVTDAAGNPVEGHPVEFRVVQGGGTLDETGQSVVTRQTNRDGLCQVRLTLGPQPGANNNVVEARSWHQGNPLDGSPVVFRASARSSAAEKLTYVSGSGQTGTVGKPLASPFRVRVTDAYGNGVEGHPVTFRVVAGGGALNGGQDSLIVKQTNAEGYAECVLTLGERAGVNNNRVEASSSNGVGPLQGSPVVFTASAQPDVPDPDSSFVWADPDTAPADGQSSIELWVRLVDRFGNPTPGKVVGFVASGGGNHIQQPSEPTDSDGRARGGITSTGAGVKTIRVRDVTDQIELSRTVNVVFTSLAAERITLFSGNNQARNVGTVLAESLAVRVEDRFGNPVADYPVRFVVTRGNGRILDPQPVRSNAQGIASVRYVLSTQPGTDLVEARAEGLTGSPVLFRLNAVSGTPAAIRMAGGDGQEGTVGQWLPELLRVEVTDEDGDPLWGVPVYYTAPLGGEPYPAVDSTDAWGVAAAHFRLGRQRGEYHVIAEAQGLQARVEFTLRAHPSEPARLTIVSGNDQRGTVGLTLPEPLVVRAEDRFGNGVAGVPVTFEIRRGGGVLSGSMPLTTDAEGLARVSWTLGTRAGEQQVTAESDELEGSPLIFTAIAVPSNPDSIALFSGDNQRGEVGQPLSLPIEAIVLDRYGNGVPGVAVTFAAVDGMSRIVETEPVNTDERGVASAHWILGPRPGQNTAMAIRLGVRGSPVVFHATGEANQYPVITAPEDTTVEEGQTIEFTVSATDPDGGAVELGASNLPQGAEFDSTHTGRFTWTPGLTSAGVYRIRFHAQDDEGGISYHVTTLRVQNLNRPPQFTDYSPRTLTLSATYPDTIRFSAVATDPDGDSLHYEWYVERAGERRLVSLGPEYLFVSTRHDPGRVTVEVLVWDVEDTAKVLWEITVLTAVELESFAAQSVPFEGVRITWKTARQVATLGFNVLRSLQKDGEYERVNTELISARDDGTYDFVDRTAQAGKIYFYKLEDVNVSGRRTQHDPVKVAVVLPKKFHLHPNFPNPFNPTTRIRFELPRPGRVRIEVFNVLGRKVCTLVDRELEAGYHEALWDGRDESGDQVASGIYYCRAVYEKDVTVRRMLLLR